MIIKATRYKPPKSALIDIRDFKGGYNSLIDEARLSSKFATAALNLIQVQDGLWQTRWGRDYYGEAISGESSILGATEYIKEDGTREIVAVGGTTGKIFKSTDGGSWTQIGTQTLTTGHQVYFLQIKHHLYIANGVDDLLRYDGSTIQEYTQLSAPTNVAVTRGSGLTSGSYNAYYQITAVNDVGETTASAEVPITVDKERDSWNVSANEYLDISWDAVTGANRYNVYYSDESGYEVFLATTTTNSYRDDGTAQPNDLLEVPDDNTTAAPKFKTMELSGNRIWATGNPDQPYRVYFSGVGQYLGAFSPWYGGGWVDLEKGGRDTPVSVVHYRTGKGDPIATILCSSPEGLGSIWQISLSAVTVNDVSFSVPLTYKIVGSIGSNAPLSVVKARDDIIFANKRGVFALRNKEQMFQVLATDEISQGIRPDYRSLNQAKLNDIAAYYYDGKVFFSAAEGDSNDMIFILDLERQNWNWKWTFGVRQFFEYTDNDGRTHFFYVPTTGNKLVEISDKYLGDFGQPFYQMYLSPLLGVSKDKTDVFKLKEALVELGRPRGSITFEVLGIASDGAVTTLGTRTISDTVSNSGFSYDLFSDFLLSDSEGTPEVYTQASVKKVIRIRKKIYNLQFKVSANAADTQFTLLGLQAKGTVLPKRAPFNWYN